MDSIAQILELAESYSRELPQPPPPPALPEGEKIAGIIDLTLIKADATSTEIKQLCEEAVRYNFFSVVVNPAYIPLAAGLLANSQILVGSVAGFPLGASMPTQKSFEALSNITAGASEIDMVLNIGAVKSKAYGLVFNDIATVAQTTHIQKAALKVIIETPFLSRDEKILACLISMYAGADFVKTASGFAGGGATVEDIDLMYRVVGAKIGVKAAVGIRDYSTAAAMVKAGATRLGTSAGINIIKEITNG
ncbi:MAG: deoxyribose-phosphate aldolase [Anaerolineales bacterium]|jgi:deoxyribose-phosphate aldolase